MPRPDGGTLQPLPGRTSRAQLRAGSDRISFGVRGRPSSAGRQSQVRRDARVCLLLSRGGKHRGDKGRWATLPAVRALQAGALPQPRKVSSKPAGPSPRSPAPPATSHAGGPGRPTSAQPHAGTPRRDPAVAACAPGKGGGHTPLPAANPAGFAAYRGGPRHR